MTLPLVSVCIPAYNHESYIQETIFSIIDQTYENLELIIIDDGSQDNTFCKVLEIKALCEKRFSRVVVQRQKNSGACLTLNKIFSISAGDYIFIIASDDVAKPYTIQKELEYLQNNPDYVLVVGDNELINDSSSKIGFDSKRNGVSFDMALYKTFGSWLKAMRNDVDFSSEEFGSYSSLVRGNYIPNGYLIATKALRKVNFFIPEVLLEDWYLMLQLSKLGKFKYCDDVFLSYRWHINNTIKKKDYISIATKRTYLYEKELVSQTENEYWDTFFKDAIEKKIKFKFGNIIQCYKEVNFIESTTILEVLGRKFVIKKRAYL